MSIDSDKAFVKKEQFDDLQKKYSVTSQELNSKKLNMDNLQNQLNKRIAKERSAQPNQVQTFNIMSIDKDQNFVAREKFDSLQKKLASQTEELSMKKINVDDL